MIKLKSKALFIIFSILMAQGAFAERDFGTIYVECGLGGLIAPNTTWAAVVTNITWDLGTTAITSELSSPESCKGVSSQSAAFIHESYEPLSQDLAQGDGAHLTALMSIPGCDTAVQPELARAIRKDFAKMVAQPDYSDMDPVQRSEGLYNIFHQKIENDFAGACNLG